MKPADPVVAIVDDDAAIRRALRRLMRALEFQSVEYESGEEFLASLGENQPSCVLLDLHMPKAKGLDVLLRMRAAAWTIPVLVITGFDQPGLRERCLAAGAAGYLLKPLDAASVQVAIQEAIAAGTLRHGGDGR
jgi:FixJ family two-component response regulator